MPTLNATDARAIAKLYYDLAVALSDYRFEQWNSLTKAQRGEIESHEWTLLTYSSNMTTHAINITTADLDGAVRSIMKATRRLVAAARKIDDVKGALAVAAKAVALGGAIASGNAVAITEATV